MVHSEAPVAQWMKHLIGMWKVKGFTFFRDSKFVICSPLLVTN